LRENVVGRDAPLCRGEVTRQRVGTRIGLFKFGGGVPEPMAQRCLSGSPVELGRLATLAKSILIGHLQVKAEVLRWLACEPLNLPRSGRIIALDVSDFEEALVDPRSPESLCPQFLANCFAAASRSRHM
jgi:hypothetical protein